MQLNITKLQAELDEKKTETQKRKELLRTDKEKEWDKWQLKAKNRLSYSWEQLLDEFSLWLEEMVSYTIKHEIDTFDFAVSVKGNFLWIALCNQEDSSDKYGLLNFVQVYDFKGQKDKLIQLIKNFEINNKKLLKNNIFYYGKRQFTKAPYKYHIQYNLNGSFFDDIITNSYQRMIDDINQVDTIENFLCGFMFELR